MQGRVDARFRRLLARALAQPRLDRLERERVIAEELARVLDERERGGRRLAVVLGRRRLAEAADAVMADLDEHHLGLVRCSA